jgi:indole-3-glycerol phosphate synthase
MSASLAGSSTGIIAEFKRKSPSKGWIHMEARVEDVVPQYEAAGASALSILTDSEYFGGDMRFVKKVRPHTTLPILRKDFIIDE